MLSQEVDQFERLDAVNDGEHQVTLAAGEPFGATLGGRLDRVVGAVNTGREEEGEGGVLEVQAEALNSN